MSHAFAQELSEEANARTKEKPFAPAEGTRGGLSEDYFDQVAEDDKRERAKTPK